MVTVGLLNGKDLKWFILVIFMENFKMNLNNLNFLIAKQVMTLRESYR
jgi:hypothetical protein